MRMIKNVLMIIAFLTLTVSMSNEKLPTIINSSTIEENPDVYPEFPGGQKEMVEYIQNNLVYPKEAKENQVEGEVTVSFIVTKRGKIKDVKVIKAHYRQKRTEPSMSTIAGVQSSLDQSSIKVVEDMPKWKPGKKDGKKVNTKMALPIVYKLPHEK